MDTKKKLIIILILAITSICFVLYGKTGKTIGQKGNTTNNKDLKLRKSIESTENTIIEENNLPNENDEVNQIIWIKNLSFLSKEQNYDILMRLKTSLNMELKTLDKDIYEVNLLEDTYKRTDKGFLIEAKADKLDGKILIEYRDFEFIFKIES